MACRVAHNPVVKLWMASQSICKQVPLERWGGLRVWSHVSISVFAEDAGCCRIQMPFISLKQLRSWSHCSPFKDSLGLSGRKGIAKVSPLWVAYSGPIVAAEVFTDPRRLFGGSAALEERERLHFKTNDEDQPSVSGKPSHIIFFG